MFCQSDYREPGAEPEIMQHFFPNVVYRNTNARTHESQTFTKMYSGLNLFTLNENKPRPVSHTATDSQPHQEVVLSGQTGVEPRTRGAPGRYDIILFKETVRLPAGLQKAKRASLNINSLLKLW